MNQRCEPNDPSQEARAKAQIRSLVERFLSDELGVIEMSRSISPLRHQVGTEFANALRTFAGIDSETDDLPVDSVRRYWNTEMLAIKDREICKAENLFQQAAIDAATRLLQLLQRPS